MSHSSTFQHALSSDAAALCNVSQRPLGLVAKMRSAATLIRSRRALAHLDAHQLADIGVSAEQAQKEARRAVWDAPSVWKA